MESALQDENIDWSNIKLQIILINMSVKICARFDKNY